MGNKRVKPTRRRTYMARQKHMMEVAIMRKKQLLAASLEGQGSPQIKEISNQPASLEVQAPPEVNEQSKQLASSEVKKSVSEVKELKKSTPKNSTGRPQGAVPLPARKITPRSCTYVTRTERLKEPGIGVKQRQKKNTQNVEKKNADKKKSNSVNKDKKTLARKKDDNLEDKLLREFLRSVLYQLKSLSKRRALLAQTRIQNILRQYCLEEMKERMQKDNPNKSVYSTPYRESEDIKDPLLLSDASPVLQYDTVCQEQSVASAIKVYTDNTKELTVLKPVTHSLNQQSSFYKAGPQCSNPDISTEVKEEINDTYCVFYNDD
ncbi:hypothetical protein K1T71_005384 [Dendrolimus kikuchii]|uniref:Uncharacterized protein n=1 Tax=Dendrolimus kikuchii TaxID=765133 RepID=A0ACC1D3V0_9NEOP|nr:hypothetical protein K1T71_005384 [Dendrolimus kikuchii]